MNHPFTMKPDTMPPETLTYAECLKRAHEYLWIVQSSRALKGTGWRGGRSDAKQKRLDKLRADIRGLLADWLAEDTARLERSEHLSRRKQIYEALHPETKNGVAGGLAGGRGREKIANEIISFANDTAAKVGVSDRSIQQEVQIAHKLTPEVKE